jgi:hypothetical protein
VNDQFPRTSGPATGVVRVTLPRVLAIAWPVGTAILTIPTYGSVYNGLLDPPDPPTTSTTIFTIAMLTWAFLIPAIGLPLSARTHSWALVGVFAAELAIAVCCGFGALLWL